MPTLRRRHGEHDGFRSGIGINQQPEHRGDDRKHGAGRKGGFPAARGGQQRNDRLTQNAARISAGVQHAGGGSRIRACNAHRRRPISAFVQLHAGERRRQTEHRGPRHRDRDRDEQKACHNRQGNQGNDLVSPLTTDRSTARSDNIPPAAAPSGCADPGQHAGDSAADATEMTDLNQIKKGPKSQKIERIVHAQIGERQQQHVAIRQDGDQASPGDRRRRDGLLGSSSSSSSRH